MGFFYGGFELIFTMIFGLVLVVMVVSLVRNLATWNQNNNSPRLTVEAEVVAKRQEVHHHHNGTHMGYHTSTRYYVTFQVASGDRMELAVPGTEYGMLVEGDRGRLNFQGSRYLGFERG